MELVFRGRVAWKLGDFISGDNIIGREGVIDPNRDADNLKKYVLVAYDPDFPKHFKKGNLLIAGRAFGGTREHGSLKAMKALGIPLIIAESFSRVILRRAISEAFPVMECKGITTFANQGDELEVDLDTGVIRNLTQNKEIKADPALEPQIQILKAGGLIPYLRKKLGT